jgi:hypothetical protein
MQKSAIDEIKELKAQLQSKTDQVRGEALERAKEGISVLRDLGIDDDMIVKELGLEGRKKAAKGARVMPTKNGRTGPKDEPCPICTFRTDPPHDGRSHRGQSKKKPFTAEELGEKGLTKV